MASAMNVTVGGALSTGLRSLFYLVGPSESSFPTIEEVPSYVTQATPFFFVLVVLEAIVLYLQGKPAVNVEDSLSSLSAGVVSRLQHMLKRAIELVTYTYVWENWRLTELRWDSPWTWWLCLLVVDFCYYWVHRMGHEVNFMWAAHQTHHSSEEYNLTTALRQSTLQNYSSWIFYLPLALVAPPSLFYVHSQFNLLYQFWIHTEVVDTLGPLEYILNTPSHHRVHHGRNRYCIDKNYGGTLIIFDRIFGTFEAEKKSDRVVYGLVHTLESRNPIYVQLCHWQYILQTAWTIPGLRNKIMVFLNGPGWSPGKPRLGELEDLPDIHHPQAKYASRAPKWYDVYVVIHFLLVLVLFEALGKYAWLPEMPVTITLTGIAYILISLTALGSLYDARLYAVVLELLRCIASSAVIFRLKFWPMIAGSVAVQQQQYSDDALPLLVAASLLALFMLSSCLWLYYVVILRSSCSDRDRKQWPWPPSGYSDIKGKVE